MSEKQKRTVGPITGLILAILVCGAVGAVGGLILTRGILWGPVQSPEVVNENTTQCRQIVVIHQAMQSVVKVINSQYPEYPASGFYIGDGIVVTAGHVSETEYTISVEFEDGTVCEVLEHITNPDFDCGFLLIALIPDDKPHLEFDPDPVKRGLVVMTLGNPTIDGLHFEFMATKGIVTGFYDADGYFGDILLFISDSVSHGGNSGSVVIDADGKIRGIYVGGKRNRLGVMIHGSEMNIQAIDILTALIAAGLNSTDNEYY